jgi:acid stress-induced BolA-like protein IbaG/YrbA
MTGTMDHLEILVVDDIFAGKMRLAQHQIVMDILKESLKDKVHAVKIKTLTPDKFNNLLIDMLPILKHNANLYKFRYNFGFNEKKIIKEIFDTWNSI